LFSEILDGSQCKILKKTRLFQQGHIYNEEMEDAAIFIINNITIIVISENNE
jgi:hypothetical protein